MGSLDFVYDLVEKMQKQDIDYFLITLRKGKETEMADLFYRFSADESINTFIELLEELKNNELGVEDKTINNILEIKNKEPREPKSPKKSKKRSSKKPPKRTKRRKKNDE